jgi:hypothetical protein
MLLEVHQAGYGGASVDVQGYIDTTTLNSTLVTLGRFRCICSIEIVED